MSTSTAVPPPHHPHPLSGVLSTLGPELSHAVSTARILLVGAGGIGCELLKNLALSGFRTVHVIDLDTVDVSNLNRQFLFRAEHVGMPKCTVAVRAALAMAPPPTSDSRNNSNGNKVGKLEYVAHHGNVKDTERFGVNSFFKTFDVVLNALDNVDARRHVNRVCLAAGVPLVEAGTTGYLGQVTVISKGDDEDDAVECYECQPKPTQKVYPICTIRSTPSMPVHTIVWAKELYKLLFHEKPETSMLYEDPNLGDGEGEGEGDGDGEKSSEGASAATRAAPAAGGDPAGVVTDDDVGEGGPSVYMEVVIDQRPVRAEAANVKDEDEYREKIRRYAHDVLDALYVREINKQLAMDRYKTAKKRPSPLDASLLQRGCGLNDDDAVVVAPSRRPDVGATDTWTPEQCVAEFASCLDDAYLRSSSTGRQASDRDDAAGGAGVEHSFPNGEFDKDDPLAMRFVTCASNLRSHLFGIDMQSLYEAKGIAGNIIPAIATTNAIVAGLQLLQVFKLLELKQGRKKETTANDDATTTRPREKQCRIRDCCRYVYCLRNKNRKGFYLQPIQLPAPNPKCFVCRNARIDVSIDTTTWTLEAFVDAVIKKRLGFHEPTIMIGDSQIHEEGEGADTESYAVNLSKLLVNLPCGGIKEGTIIRVEDFSQDLEVDLCISHRSEWDEKEEPDGFYIGGEAPAPKKAPGGNDENDASTKKADGEDEGSDGADDDDDVVVVVQNPSSSSGVAARPPVGGDESTKKRPRNYGSEEDSNGALNDSKKARQDNAADSEIVMLDVDDD